MVIRWSEELDKSPLVVGDVTVGDVTVRNTEQYTYLGLIVTQDRSIPSSVKAHCKSKMAHAIKFEAFVKKNADMPFPAKRKVFSAALVLAILYASETWLAPNAWKKAAPMYTSCVKSLLGVQKTTAT